MADGDDQDHPQDHEHTHDHPHGDDSGDHSGGLPFRDEALAVMVELLDLGVSFGVSLLVGGTWVTGVAISGQQWFRELAEGVRRSGSSEAAELFAGAVRELGDSIYGPVSDQSLPIGFIHLNGARALAGGAPVEEGRLVRLRLDRVDGWLLGELRAPLV